MWHYQWLLVNEHLPQIAGQAVVNDVLQRGNRLYKPPPGDAFMPIEFGAAAYRFGHSMVRPSYRANSRAAPATAATRPKSRSSDWYSIPNRAPLTARSPATAMTCSAATQPPTATSAGRHSSTSVTVRSRTTRRSTPRYRASCSRCRSPRSRHTPSPPRLCCRNATSCASSHGSCPQDKRSLRHSAHTPGPGRPR